jgi:zinc and cadmium transporter
VLILLGDALHNFIGGLGIASTFLMNPAAGVAAWCAAVAHEVPQELGDFAILLHSGWKPQAALRWNFISALTFPLGAVLAWLIAQALPVGGLVLFASGNFLYIAASDLVPEIKAGTSLRSAAFSFGWFLAGLLLMQAIGG